MNRIFKLSLYFLLSLSVVFTSCKKEEVVRPDNTNTYVVNTSEVEGVNWVLAEGRVYTENLDNGDLNVYDHFGGSQTYSNLSVYSTSIPCIDSVNQNSTTWFFSNGTFTLNGSKTYNYNDSHYTFSVYGLEDGSSRPIEVTHLTDDVMTVKVHEGYDSDGTYNYKYYSQLTFVRASTTCNNCEPATDYGYVYSGVWNYTQTNSAILEGTQWVVVKYINGFGVTYPNDTLDFFSSTQYTINGGSPRIYTLNDVIGNNMKSLNLYSFTTLGGDYGGEVVDTFVDDWIINNATFTDLFNVNNDVVIWFERIN